MIIKVTLKIKRLQKIAGGWPRNSVLALQACLWQLLKPAFSAFGVQGGCGETDPIRGPGVCGGLGRRPDPGRLRRDHPNEHARNARRRQHLREWGCPRRHWHLQRHDASALWHGPPAADPSKSATDGSRYVRTVILASNTFGLGSFNDKTGIQVDQASGNVYAAWSDFHGSGCNEIVFSRSTDHGATFSAPLKISSVCNNQGPNIAIGPSGQVYVSWFANTGGTKSLGGNFSEGAAFATSTDGGQTFSMATIAVPFTPFVSSQFSGNGARQCGDAPFACPTGQTFPRFDLAQPSLTTNGNDIVMAFQGALANGQGQALFSKSSDGGATWSTPVAIDAQAKGHQFFPWITAANGRLRAVYYASRLDANYSATVAPCNDAHGNGYACLGVWYSSSTDGGATWSHQELTSALTNPNFEQFGGRAVPFFGDYIMVSAVGNAVEAVWTDARDVVAAPDSDGNDPAGDSHLGGPCTSSFTTCFDGTGGLDQNIYTANVS